MNQTTKPFSLAKSKQLPRSNHYIQTPFYRISSNQDISKQYLVKSQEETRISKTAQSKRKILHAYGRIVSATKAPKSSNNYALAEDVEIFEALRQKTGIDADNREAFQEGFLQKLALQQKQNELKRRICEERKLKDKVYLKNCKLLNVCKVSQKNTKIVKEESTQNLVLICMLASECSDLDREVEQAQILNAELAAKIYGQQQAVAQLEDIVLRSQVIIERKVLKIDQIMQRKTAEHKTMTKLYKTIIQLKQEKALLIKRNKKSILQQ